MAGYHRHLKVFLLLMLFGILLTPAFSLAAGLPNMRLEEILIGLLFGYLLVRGLGGQRIEFVWGVRQTMLLAFPLFLFISIAAGLVLGYAGSLGDLNQLVRVIKYLIIYTVAVSVIGLSPDPEQTKNSILNWTLAFGCVLVLITTQQYYDWFGLNSRYFHLITADWEYQRLLAGRLNRPLGMVGNPNELGFLLAVVAIAALHQLLARFRPFYLGTFVLALLGILMTGSRSSLVACAAGSLILGLVLSISRMPAKLRFAQRAGAVLGAVVLLALAGALTDVYGGLLDRFEALAELDRDESWQARLVKWEENVRLFEQSPVVGVGPLRRGSLDFVNNPDNEWWLLLRSYGILGTLFLLATFLLPHFLGPWVKPAALALALYAAAALFMIPAAVFHSLALMPLMLILVALSDTTLQRRVLR